MSGGIHEGTGNERIGARMNGARQMYHYHVWANAKVLHHLGILPKEVLTQQMQSVFSSIKDVLGHMYIVDNVWLRALSGEGATIPGMLPVWQEELAEADLDKFRALFDSLTPRYESFFAQHPDLAVMSDFPHPTFGKLRASYSEIVHHIVNHGTYHRGNITAMLRQLGYDGPSTDYVFYLYTLQP